MSGHPLVVVGIGHDGPAGLSAEAKAQVAAAQVLAGGRRHLDFFPERTGEKIVIDADLDKVVIRLSEVYATEKTVILASGDPLFYGIGGLLLRSFPREHLVFLPQVSSVQLAFARIKETWHDAKIVSLHGRPLETLRPAVLGRAAKIAVLTDGQNHPGVIGDLLRQLGAAEDYTCWVCENLGGTDELIGRHPATHLKEDTFSPLNIVVLVLRDGKSPGGKPKHEVNLPLLGIPESVLRHRAGPRGLITRREVRILALCYLELHPGDQLWDLGAGSGSVSLEAARLSSAVRILALERDPERFRQLEANIAEFGAGRVQAVCAEAPEGLVELPDPDAVFIGGSGGRLRDILDVVMRRLKPGGRLVLNCITLENLGCGWEWLQSQGHEPEVTSVQLAHSRPLGRLHSLEPDNLIFILRARKR